MPHKSKISYAQKALPFAGQSARAIQEPFKREWRAVTIAGGVALVLCVLYGYAVVTSIAQVSLREAALKESRSLTAERAVLEGQYLAKTSGITVEYARSLGYTDSSNRVFVERKGTLSYAPDAR